MTEILCWVYAFIICQTRYTLSKSGSDDARPEKLSFFQDFFYLLTVFNSHISLRYCAAYYDTKVRHQQKTI